MYNAVIRGLQRLGLADAYGESRIPLYVLNVTYPLVDAEIVQFCRRQARRADGGGRAARIHRAGAAHHPAPRRRAAPACTARACCRWPANTRGRVIEPGCGRSSRRLPDLLARPSRRRRRVLPTRARRRCRRRAAAPALVLHRLPGAADLHGDEAGGEGTRPAPRLLPTSAATCSPSCRRSTSAHHDGLRPRRLVRRPRSTWPAASAPISRDGRWRLLAQRPDHRRRQRRVQQARQRPLMVDNGYSAATGGQDILSSRADNPAARTKNPIEARCAASASSGCGSSTAPTTSAGCATSARGADHRSKGPKVDRRRLANAC